MTTTIQAVYDGLVLRPEQPLPLEANTRVRLTVETVEEPADDEPTSFFATAQSLRIEGPRDWATNLDRYLYDRAPDGG